MNLKPGDKAWLWRRDWTARGLSLCTVEKVTPKRIKWGNGAMTDHAGKGNDYQGFATREEVRAHLTARARLRLRGELTTAINGATLPQLITIADLLGVAVPAVLRGQETAE